MTNEEVCSRLYEALHLQAVQSEEEETGAEDCERGRRVRNMIARFERGLAAGVDETPDEGDEFGERRRNSTVAMQPGTVNVIHAHLAQLFPVSSHGRDSSISVNSILSGISEVSFESESSGIGSETRSSGLYARSDGRTLYRRAPPPPDSPTSTASRSPLPDEDSKYQLSPGASPVVLRRSKLPPVMRRKSIADGNQNGLEVHWSYGVKQVDLEKIIKRRKASEDVHEEDEPEDETTVETTVDESETKEESDEGREDEIADGEDVTKLDRVSVDNSVDTLINESEQCDSDQFDTSTIASDFSAERSNCDNVSIRSVSSFDMGPYIKYDSITVSSDEFGSESNIHREQDSDNSSVSAVHDWNTRSVDPILLPSESKKEKYRRRLTERVNELLHTEAVYVDKLRHVVADYIPEMSRPDVPSGIRGLRFEIFANIERIYRFHSAQLLPALRDCEHDLRKLGQCFRKFEHKFQMYVIYSRNNKRSNRIVFENKRFFQEKQLELGERLDLSSYLLEPVQRLPRYKLFIDDLVKTYQNYEAECEGDSRISKLSGDGSETSGSGDAESEAGSEALETTLQSLTAAKAMIEALLTTVDDIIALENIRDCPINLMNQGKLLRQNEFTVADGYKRRHLMRMFLFERVVLFTLVYKKQLTVEIFLYFDHIPVDELGITSKDNDLHNFRIWYQRRNLKNYKLSTGDSAVRSLWVQEIMALLWKQAMVKKETILRNRNNRSSMISNSSQLSETSSSNSTIATSEKYNSLRGVPGEVKRYSQKTSSRRTTWYCE